MNNDDIHFQKYAHDPLLNETKPKMTSRGLSPTVRKIAFVDLDYRFPNEELIKILLEE